MAKLNRRKPAVIATRMTEADAMLVRASASAAGISVNRFVYETLMPAVRRDVTAQLDQIHLTGSLAAPHIATEMPAVL